MIVITNLNVCFRDTWSLIMLCQSYICLLWLDFRYHVIKWATIPQWCKPSVKNSPYVLPWVQGCISSCCCLDETEHLCWVITRKHTICSVYTYRPTLWLNLYTLNECFVKLKCDMAGIILEIIAQDTITICFLRVNYHRPSWYDSAMQGPILLTEIS